MDQSELKIKTWIRRNYLINPSFQIRFIIYTVGAALLAVLAVYLTSSYFFWSFQEKGREIGLSDGHVFFAFLEQQEAYMNQLLLGLSLFFIVGLSIWGVILSHRVAGPLYRLNKHMWQVARGELIPPLSFRDKDFFQELTTAYNAQYQYLKHGAQRGKKSGLSPNEGEPRSSESSEKSLGAS